MTIPMYIERVPNRNSPPAVLLRSSHWDHGKIRKVTHANLSKLPQPLVDAIALLLRGGTVVGPGSPAVRILDSRPCGHVAALLGGARQLGLPGLLHVRPSRSRDLALALVLMRLLLPASRLATARKLAPDAEFAALNEAVVFQFVSVDFTKLFHELVRSLFELVHYCRRELGPGKGPVEPYVSVKLATVTLSCSSELIHKIPRPCIGII